LKIMMQHRYPWTRVVTRGTYSASHTSLIGPRAPQNISLLPCNVRVFYEIPLTSKPEGLQTKMVLSMSYIIIPLLRMTNNYE
jgi:hypothetical protein